MSRTAEKQPRVDLLRPFEGIAAGQDRAIQSGVYVTHRELALAARVHESLLPIPVWHPQIDVETRYVPVSGIGGDYCQVLFPDESTCCLSICDVTGHGVGPALLATRVSSEVRWLTYEGRRPVEILAALNEFLLDHFRDAGLQVSFFAALVDLDRRTITFSGGGHPAQILIRRDGQQIELLRSQNMLLGVRENCLSDEPEHELPLAPGDVLLLFTDGLTETLLADGALLGEPGLIGIARDLCTGSMREVVDCIVERVAERRHGPPRDDVTLIAAKMTHPCQ